MHAVVNHLHLNVPPEQIRDATQGDGLASEQQRSAGEVILPYRK